MRTASEMAAGLKPAARSRLFWLALCAAVAIALIPSVSPALHPGDWTGSIGELGPAGEVQTTHADLEPFKGPFTVTVTNTGSAAWGDFHFGIFDPIGGQDISNVDFQDASMGGEDPTSSQAGLTWVINNQVVGATIDLYFCSDPVMPGETATFMVYTANPDHLSFFGILFYPTPVPPSGACCAPDASCTLTCEHDCLAPGVWHPEWGSCLPNPCPGQMGACCDPYGGCSFTLEVNCPFPNIWYIGQLCSPSPCEPLLGICCFSDGHCEFVTEAVCAAAPEHLYWQWGLACAPENPCPPPIPTGACCDALGNCTITTEIDCPAPNVWHPEWTSCEPNFCPPPVPADGTTWGQIKATYR